MLHIYFFIPQMRVASLPCQLVRVLILLCPFFYLEIAVPLSNSFPSLHCIIHRTLPLPIHHGLLGLAASLCWHKYSLATYLSAGQAISAPLPSPTLNLISYSFAQSLSGLFIEIPSCKFLAVGPRTTSDKFCHQEPKVHQCRNREFQTQHGRYPSPFLSVHRH